jgi:hypothetical protein
MSFRSAFFSSVALSALAAPAFAQVTADDIWASQTRTLSSLGFVVEATPQRDGATLVMSDVRIVWAVPMGFGEVSITSPDVTMVENGDGSVAISYPDKFRISIRADLTIEGESGSVGADIGIRFDDMTMTASGTPQAIAYETRAGLVDVVLDRLIAEGEAGGPEDIPPVNVILTLRDLSTSTTITDDGTLQTVATTSTTGQSIFEFSLDDGYGFVSTTVGAVDSSTATSTLALPATPVDWLNLSTALRNGFALESVTDAVGSRQQSVVTMDGTKVSDQSQSAERSSQSLALSAAGLAMSFGGEGIRFDMNDDMLMPLPVSVSAGEMSTAFAMPVLADTAPQPVSFSLAIRGVTVDEQLWGMVDPGAVLPRDPATLAFAIDAQMINRIDLFDIMGWQTFASTFNGSELPADIVSLDITGVEASAIGATVSGDGAFTFDSADTTTFPGFPRPQGEASVQMTGVYGVLEKLSQLGLLGMEESMGARAAIGMFAQATGDDQLTTTLSITPDGTLTINGAPIPF